MAEHNVDASYRAKIPVAAAGNRRYRLHCVRILPEVTVAHNAAEMVAVVLSVAMVPAYAVIGQYPLVRKEPVALVHIGPVVVVCLERVALNEGT